MNTDTSIVPSRKEAAEALGITERQLGTWAQEAWFPPGAVSYDDKGNHIDWDVETIRRAREIAGRKGSELSETARKLKLKTDHERLLQAEIKTRKERRQLEVMESELIPRYALELFASTLLTSLGDWCDTVPDLVAASVPKKYQKAVRERVEAELNSRRHQMATDLQAAARDFDSKDGTHGQDGPREEANHSA